MGYVEEVEGFVGKASDTFKVEEPVRESSSEVRVSAVVERKGNKTAALKAAAEDAILKFNMPNGAVDPVSEHVEAIREGEDVGKIRISAKVTSRI